MADVRELLLRITGDSRDAEAALNKIARKVIEQNRLKGNAKVELTGFFEAEAKLIALEAQLKALDAENVSPEVKVDVDRSLTRIALLRAQMRDIFNTPALERDGKQVSRILASVATEAGNVGSTIAKAAGPTSQLNSQFSGMLGAVKQVNPVLQGLGLVIFVTLIPAFVALAASLVGAVAGLGALVVALGAALGPALIGLIAVFQRIAAVMAVRQQRQAALNAETRRAASADAEAAAQAERVRNAQNTVRDAMESRTAAARALAKAEKDAAQALVDARVAATAAAAQIKSETVNAYRAMEDAADRASDAVRGVAEAQLGIEDASVATRRAQLELKKFREEVGAGGGAFDGLFKKFTDVNFNPKGLRGALASALPGQNGEDQLKLEELILAVRHAKLGEKTATDNLKDSTRELSRARQDDQVFQNKGIKGYEPYVAALKTASDANKALATAQSQGISHNPQVIAAQDALRDANQRVVEAQHDLRIAKQKTDASLQDTGPQAIYEKALGKLSDSERRLLDSITKFAPALKGFGRSISDPVLGAFADVLDGLKDRVGGIMGLFDGLGDVFATNVRGLFADLASDPKWADSFVVFADAAKRVSALLGGPIFRDFFAILRNIAVATMPLLVDGFGGLADGLSGLRAGTDDTEALGKTIGGLVDSTKSWVKLIGAAIGFLLKLATTGSGAAGNSLVDSMTKSLHSIGDWLSSHQDDIKDFFKDALPAIKSVMKFLGKLLIFFAQLYRFFAPAIKFVVDGFSLVLDVLNFVLSLLNKIPAPIRGLLGAFFPFGGVIKAAFLPLKLVRPAIDVLLAVLGRFAPAVKALVEPIAAIFRAAFKPIAGLARGAFSFVLTAVKTYIGGVVTFLRGYVSVIKTVLGTVFGVFRKGFEPIAALVKRVVGGIVSAVKGIAGATENVFNRVLGIFRAVFNTVADILNIFLGGVNALIRAINGLPSIKTPLGNIGFPDIPEIPKIPKLAGGGIATSSVLAQIGEAGKEAVLPLTQSVLGTLGRAIVAAMSPGTLSAATLAGVGASGGRGAGVHVDQIVLPPAPAAAVPDARYQAVQLAAELGRRGGGTS